MVQINLRLSKVFLKVINAIWKEEGFNSRSEYLRYAVRDLVKHSPFAREGSTRLPRADANSDLMVSNSCSVK